MTTHVQQPENPAQATTQSTEETVRQELPGGTNIVTSRRTQTTIGAAQKDTGRDIAAKLGSFKGIQYLGAFVFLFGVASAVWPYLKVIIGSVTTSAVIALSGLALVFLPALIVGNELLILGGCAFAAVAYWFAHRHGRLQGFVDANKDGIDDRTQGANNAS